MPLHFVRADLTQLHVDAIVNAANPQLLMGGGVCGAIFRAAGAEQMTEACNRIGFCPTGQAVITPGFRLPARCVIHTSGPVWQGGGAGEEALLRSCYTSSLRLAASHKLESVAFPLISGGIYGYPPALALQTAVSAISAFLSAEDAPDMDVTLALYGQTGYLAGCKLFGDITAYIDQHYAPLRRYEAEVRDGRESRRSRWEAEDTLAPPPPKGVAAPPAPKAAKPTASKDVMDVMPTASEPKTARMLHAIDWGRLTRRKEETFSQCLLRLIDQRGLKDTVVYKRANIDRKLFSKIRCNPSYQPRKATAMALCLALELNAEDTAMLLGRAGFALSPASLMDQVVACCIEQRFYDVNQINLFLYDHDLALLGA